IMDTSEVEVNPYELLSLGSEATDQDIRTAYRKLSLKVHPDRVGNPDAARKFHELNQAYELLLDPLRRMALDAKVRLKEAKAQRFKQYDSKRKAMVEELEERERAFKKAKMEQQKEEVARWHETEKIKEEGKRLREERQR
ncbi:DnaJ-domain-containing protein, partial [Schizophyllum commune H4-8]